MSRGTQVASMCWPGKSLAMVAWLAASSTGMSGAKKMRAGRERVAPPEWPSADGKLWEKVEEVGLVLMN